MGYILNIDNQVNIKFSNDGKKASLDNGTTFTKIADDTYVNDKTGVTYKLNSRGMNTFQNGDSFTSSTGNTFKVKGVLYESNQNSSQLRESLAATFPDLTISNSKSGEVKACSKTSKEVQQSFEEAMQ